MNWKKWQIISSPSSICTCIWCMYILHVAEEEKLDKEKDKKEKWNQ